MIDVNELRKGVIFVMDGSLFRVLFAKAPLLKKPFLQARKFKMFAWIFIMSSICTATVTNTTLWI
jgi:hypothetical protein